MHTRIHKARIWNRKYRKKLPNKPKRKNSNIRRKSRIQRNKLLHVRTNERRFI